MRSAGRLLAAAACLGTLAGCAAPPPGPAAPATSPAVSQAAPATEAASLGAAVYARECASCHGPRGEGQPNWALRLPDGSLPAPPHDNGGHTWHHSDAELVRIIDEGGTWYDPQSKMPAYRGKLSPAEIEAVIAHIKGWWGPKERAWQAEMTAQWRAQLAARRPTATAGP